MQSCFIGMNGKQIDSDFGSAGKPALMDAVPQALAVSFARSMWL